MNLRRYISSILPLAGILLLAAGCSGGSDPVTPDPTEKHNKPHWSLEPGRRVEQAPAWTPIDDELLSSSMTVTVGLDETLAADGVSAADMVAAFSGGDCLGVTHVNNQSGKPRFYLYVLSPRDDRKTVTLAYYSAGSQRVYYWSDILGFENNRVVGSARQPFELKLAGENHGLQYSAQVGVALPMSSLADADEVAAFVGGECRQVLTAKDRVQDRGGLYCQFVLPMSSSSEQVGIRYYSHTEDRVYASREYPVTAGGVCAIDKLEWQ